MTQMKSRNYRYFSIVTLYSAYYFMHMHPHTYNTIHNLFRFLSFVQFDHIIVYTVPNNTRVKASVRLTSVHHILVINYLFVPVVPLITKQNMWSIRKLLMIHSFVNYVPNNMQQDNNLLCMSKEIMVNLCMT